MPSAPVAARITPSHPAPTPLIDSQGKVKSEELEDVPKGSRPVATSSLSGQPPSNPNINLGVSRAASTKTISDVSAALGSLDVDPLLPKVPPSNKKPASRNVCSPPSSPRQSPPSPDSSSPSVSNVNPPPASPSPAPSRKRSSSLLDDDEALVVNALADMNASVTKVILNTDSPFLSVITPNGAAADAKSTFSTVADEVWYSLILEGVGELKPDDFLTYFKNNQAKNPPVTDNIVVHSGTAILKYATPEEWEHAKTHKWAFGKVWLPKDFDPKKEYDVFYRICFSGSDFNIENLHQRVKAFFMVHNIDVTNAQVTSNARIMMMYVRARGDWKRYEALRLKKRVFSLPAYGRDKYPTIFVPIPALTNTNDAEVFCIFVGKVVPGSDEYLVRERIRMAAVEGNFDPEDVISFGAYRYPGSTKTSRYGYLHVYGKDLADYLITAKIDTKEGPLELAYATEKPKSNKKQRGN